MQKIILYSTVGCHLCELAKEQLEPLIDQYSLVIEEVDIATDEALLNAYGVNIPVLYIERLQHTVYWPFATDAIDECLRR